MNDYGDLLWEVELKGVKKKWRGGLYLGLIAILVYVGLILYLNIEEAKKLPVILIVVIIFSILLSLAFIQIIALAPFQVYSNRMLFPEMSMLKRLFRKHRVVEFSMIRSMELRENYDKLDDIIITQIDETIHVIFSDSANDIPFERLKSAWLDYKKSRPPRACSGEARAEPAQGRKGGG
jgi:hypothetical protein